MEKRRILTVMTFPQRFDGNELIVNIVVVPRNADPFSTWPTGLTNPFPSHVAGFADLQPEFQLAIVRGTDDFPLSNATADSRKPILRKVEVTAAANKKEYLEQVAKSFDGKITDTSDKLPDPVPMNEAGKRGIKKYLPLSYRNRFNFTVPRTPNAVTDDSYHCAIRDKVELIDDFKLKSEISWGKVFANILRQPILAKACGMIYETKLKVEPGWFENGGYLYAEIVDEKYELAQEELLKAADGPLIKRYAAKIPNLKIGGKRPVFAPVLFPVLYQIGNASEPIPPGPWDELFLEAHLYNDGFAKIVHANQAESGNLLEEKPDGLSPQSDSGIRLGWDDEQILVWYLRQILENSSEPGSNKRLDAALGVMGYHIDVKKADAGSEWESLNVIQINPSQNELARNFSGQRAELPYQVYPTKIAGIKSSSYWLPMYYAYWIGKSLSTEDRDAMEIYKTNQVNGKELNGIEKGMVNPNQVLSPGEIKTLLRYGNTYRFRIRMADISGGGPALTDEPLNAAPSPETSVSFKRFVNPGMLRIDKPEEYRTTKFNFFNSRDSSDSEFKDNVALTIERPLLEYPAVVFTDKYQKLGQDPVAMLKSMELTEVFRPALPDPDVTKIQILVEVKSLRMDTQLSRSGQDSFIPLYSRAWDFPLDFFGKITLPIKFLDVPVLNLGEQADPFLSQKLEFEALSETALVLPSGRQVRVSLQAVATTDGEELDYFGIIDPDIEKDSRYGKVQQLLFYKETQNEAVLLKPYKNIPELQGLYLKPDPVLTTKQISIGSRLRRKSENDQPDVVQRIADALGLSAKGLTLMAKKGERVAFGCSSRIRHSIAPDGSSITFANKSDLYYHWITCLSYQLNRDWTWDGHEDLAFVIHRRHRFRREPKSEIRTNNYLDDIELKHTVSFEALQADRFDLVNRHYTRIIYLDALEPKNDRAITQGSNELRYPDELWAEYTLEPKLKKGHAPAASVETDLLKLPTVLIPSQTPKVVSVGLAFSPYDRAEDYSSTEARRKFLWVEFEEPIQNPDDAYFCRMLANAPDQLISNNDEDLFQVPEESSLSLDPEVIRRIIPNQSDDKSGIDAMIQMVQATDSNRHYLLPIPPGLHPESPEMFGFFTYEFRVGHAHFKDREKEDEELNVLTFESVNDFELMGGTPKGNLWSTAQARFGRELRVTGMQHPAPTLLCSLNRNENYMYVSAPFAKAVFQGKNVTSKPPRTSLWALLYAQVHQADGLDHRNILLAERKMRIDVRINTDQKALDRINDLTKQTYFQPNLAKYSKGKFEFSQSQISLATFLANIKESHPVGTAVFTSQEIAEYLTDLGLPEDSDLSVLVVEVFGNITNLSDHVNRIRPRGASNSQEATLMAASNRKNEAGANVMDNGSVLGNNLGNFRILRTSPLTKVPFVCCPTCE